MQLKIFCEPRDDLKLPNETAGKRVFEAYMDLFREAAEGPLANVERKMPLRTKVNGWPIEPNEALEKPVATQENFRGFLEDMHSAWGGELSVDGFVCFKDSFRVSQLFKGVAIADL